jgi:hypothetical protein
MRSPTPTGVEVDQGGNNGRSADITATPYKLEVVSPGHPDRALTGKNGSHRNLHGAAPGKVADERQRQILGKSCFQAGKASGHRRSLEGRWGISANRWLCSGQAENRAKSSDRIPDLLPIVETG